MVRPPRQGFEREADPPTVEAPFGLLSTTASMIPVRQPRWLHGSENSSGGLPMGTSRFKGRSMKHARFAIGADLDQLWK